MILNIYIVCDFVYILYLFYSTTVNMIKNSEKERVSRIEFARIRSETFDSVVNPKVN